MDVCRTEKFLAAIGIRDYDRSVDYVIPVAYVAYREIGGNEEAICLSLIRLCDYN
jgi:hypothetical protein